MKSMLLALSSGATRNAVTKGHLEAIEILEPPSSLLTAFEQITLPWFDQIDNNRAQSRTLAILRETLLPKLLSGKLRVAQADKLVEAVI
jgi:type I restriction enzyme S subunit